MHLKRRLNWRISVLGLVLSMGLIFGASGIIRLNAVERAHATADVEDVCGPQSQPGESFAAPPAVPSEGHRGVERNLQG
jgi:hypothetical protein